MEERYTIREDWGKKRKKGNGTARVKRVEKLDTEDPDPREHARIDFGTRASWANQTKLW